MRPDPGWYRGHRGCHRRARVGRRASDRRHVSGRTRGPLGQVLELGSTSLLLIVHYFLDVGETVGLRVNRPRGGGRTRRGVGGRRLGDAKAGRLSRPGREGVQVHCRLEASPMRVRGRGACARTGGATKTTKARATTRAQPATRTTSRSDEMAGPGGRRERWRSDRYIFLDCFPRAATPSLPSSALVTPGPAPPPSRPRFLAA